jgi:hypothetical protein
MCHRAHQLAVLDDGGAAHECVQVGTTHFYNFLTVSTLFIKIIVLRRSILPYFLTQTNTQKLFYLIFGVCKQMDSLDDSYQNSM